MGRIVTTDLPNLVPPKPPTSSTAARHQKTFHKANVVVSTRSSTVARFASPSSIGPPITLTFRKCLWICALLAHLSRNVLLYSLFYVLVHLQLVRRCDDSGHVCSFSGKKHRQLGSCSQNRFLHRSLWVRFVFFFVARALVRSFHARISWTNKKWWLG